MTPADVKVKINASLRKTREELDKVEETASGFSQKIAGIEASRLHTYKALAKIRLDEIAASTVVSELSIAEQKARTRFDAFTRLCGQVLAERRTLEAQISQAQEQRTEIENQIDATRAEIAALTNGTRKRLNEIDEWVVLLREANLLSQKFVAADKKAQESEADRENKSKPYLADDVFRYLHEKKFGTSAYTGSGLTRWGDESVAKVIGFESARRDFVMLNELPVRLRAHGDGLRQTLDAQVAEMRRRFRVETEKDGVCVPEAKLKEQNQALNTLIQKTDALQVALQENQARYEALTEGNDENGLNAVLAFIVKALQSQNLTDLMRQAMATPTPEDDALVSDLGRLNANLARAQAELRKSHEQLKVLKDRETQLEDARRHVGKSGRYDGSFQGEDRITETIDAIYRGNKQLKDLTTLLAENFVKRPWWDSDSSSSGNDWSWSSSSDSGFGGGGFSSGGGFGGGGFTTGGGF
jgi:uncharacterized membrane protein YgcG/archaellum component FlaC